MSEYLEADAAKQEVITQEQAQFFRENGLLVIRNVVRGEELKAMQDQTRVYYDKACASKVNDVDYMYKKHEITGEDTPFRVEYVIDKTQAGKALLAHPFILRSVERLQTRDFLPTWDSMVFKREGMGVAIPWHRDAGPYQSSEVDQDVAAFNVDFYLDGSDLTNCLWGIFGSNRWPQERAQQKILELNRNDEFHTEGAQPIVMNPGDVIFHNILALHGSPAAQSKIRRVIYYEFRPLRVEQSFGPHILDYIPLKQKVLLACLRERAKAPYAKGEYPFEYRPSPEFAPPVLKEGEQLPTYRYPHGEFWRGPKK